MPFNSAPDVVLEAKTLIEERARTVLRDPVTFNEVLSAAYMEKQKMSVCIRSLLQLYLLLSSIEVSQRQRTWSWACCCIIVSWVNRLHAFPLEDTLQDDRK